jgi:hypothetical protein
MITGLGDADLLDWNTFERIREEFACVELEFRLRRQMP